MFLRRLLYRYESLLFFFFFFFNDTATTEIYTLSLHDALPIPGRSSNRPPRSVSAWPGCGATSSSGRSARRSEEHTSELQSRFDLVCRLLLEKKKITVEPLLHRSKQSDRVDV